MGGFSNPAVSAQSLFPPWPCCSFPQPCTLLHMSQAQSRAACAPDCLFKDACLPSGLDRENAPPSGEQGDLFSGVSSGKSACSPYERFRFPQLTIPRHAQHLPGPRPGKGNQCHEGTPAPAVLWVTKLFGSDRSSESIINVCSKQFPQSLLYSEFLYLKTALPATHRW